MKKNKLTKIMAFLALFGIIIGIIGTGLLVIFSTNENIDSNIEQQQLIELQNYLNTLSGSTESLSGIEIETLTGTEIE